MIDVNVWLGHYPFRRVPFDEPAALAEMLRAAGVQQAWAGHFDALLHRDVAGVNRRLAAVCASHGEGLFLPFGAVNPMLPDWEDDLRRCVEEHGMKGLRLIPTYHGYDLALPALRQLFERAADRRLILQLVWRLEDERTQHPLVPLAKLDPKPLGELLKAWPSVPVMLLNSQRDVRPDQAAEWSTLGTLSVDIAMLEGAAGIARWQRAMPYQQIVFGSYAPVFVHEAARLKLQESELAEPVRQAIVETNARELLARVE